MFKTNREFYEFNCSFHFFYGYRLKNCQAFGQVSWHTTPFSPLFLNIFLRNVKPEICCTRMLLTMGQLMWNPKRSKPNEVFVGIGMNKNKNITFLTTFRTLLSQSSGH